MASLEQRIYWMAPGFVRDLMASAFARRRDRERFGPPYEDALRGIAQRDRWPEAQLAEYQRRALRTLLRHAIDRVPYYRRRYSEMGIKVESIRGPEDLPRLPILEKHTVRADPESLLDETRNRRRLLVGNTSGTTGLPLKLYRDERLVSTGFAYFDGRCHDVAGVRRRRDRSVSIGGHLVGGPSQSKPPFWVHNRHWRQLYMSSYHLSPLYLPSYVSRIRSFRPDYIEGYPSSVYAIARFMIDNGLEPVVMKACFTTAETLFEHQREAFARAFGCPTYDQYGCGEYAVFASECAEGSMHVSPDYGIVELVDGQDRPVEPGRIGEAVCTSLINFVQPFIRYRIGDVASFATRPCSCGRPFPVLERLEGRVDQVLHTRDGRKIGRLDPVLKGVEHVGECQFVQERLDHFRIRVVPATGYRDADGATLVANLAERVGDARIELVLEESIERTAAGKFLAVVCKLSREEIASGGGAASEG